MPDKSSNDEGRSLHEPIDELLDTMADPLFVKDEAHRSRPTDVARLLLG